MPIVGLTDRGLSFPEIGQIRKGAKKTENKPGADLTYFRVEFDERDKKAAETFHEIYGDKPTAIRIILPFNEIERMWDAWLRGYTAGRTVARSDGEKFTYLLDCNTGEMLVKNGIDIMTGQARPYVEGKPVGFYTTGKGEKKPIYCKPSGRLRVIIPELARAAYLTVLTTSIHDIGNISDQLRAFQTLNNGRIAGIPLILRRRPKSISTPNTDGTRARRVKWLLSIEADPEWVKAALQETKRLALPGNGLALSPGSDMELNEPQTDHDEGEIEDGEFSDTQPDEIPVEPPEPKITENAPAKKAHANGIDAPLVRPLAPEVLADFLNKKAKRHTGDTCSPAQRGLVAMLLNTIFAGDQDKRHTVQAYLLGASSLTDAADEMVLAALDWLKPVQDSGGAYTPDQMAEREAQAVYTASLIVEGQAALL